MLDDELSGWMAFSGGLLLRIPAGSCFRLLLFFMYYYYPFNARYHQSSNQQQATRTKNAILLYFDIHVTIKLLILTPLLVK